MIVDEYDGISHSRVTPMRLEYLSLYARTLLILELEDTLNL